MPSSFGGFWMTGDVKVSPPPHFVGALFLSLAIARLPLTPSRLSVDKSRQTLGRQPFPFTRPWRRLVAEGWVWSTKRRTPAWPSCSGVKDSYCKCGRLLKWVSRDLKSAVPYGEMDRRRLAIRSSALSCSSSVARSLYTPRAVMAASTSPAIACKMARLKCTFGNADSSSAASS